MQTFLPYSSFTASAYVLDNRRLGKQRVECKQIYLNQWQHHPAVAMWRNHEVYLLDYAIAICKEWIGRSYDDNLLPWFECERSKFSQVTPPPSWLGDERLHSNHRARLLAKNFDWYKIFKWREVPVEENYWPTYHV